MAERDHRSRRILHQRQVIREQRDVLPSIETLFEIDGVPHVPESCCTRLGGCTRPIDAGQDLPTGLGQSLRLPAIKATSDRDLGHDPQVDVTELRYGRSHASVDSPEGPDGPSRSRGAEIVQQFRHAVRVTQRFEENELMSAGADQSLDRGIWAQPEADKCPAIVLVVYLDLRCPLEAVGDHVGAGSLGAHEEDGNRVRPGANWWVRLQRHRPKATCVRSSGSRWSSSTRREPRWVLPQWTCPRAELSCARAVRVLNELLLELSWSRLPAGIARLTHFAPTSPALRCPRRSVAYAGLHPGGVLSGSHDCQRAIIRGSVPLHDQVSNVPIESDPVSKSTEDPRRTTVAFIAGTGRSGSTLLARALGQSPERFAAGEVRYLFDRGIEQNRRCGCGKPFAECPPGSPSWRRHSGRWAASTPAAAVACSPRIHGFDICLPSWSPPSGGSASPDLVQLREALRRLYAAIQSVTGAEVIVDSSKLPAYLWILAGIPELDLRVVHLVRDPRGAAFSWQRPKELTDGAPVSTMQQLPPMKSALLWLWWNAATSVRRVVHCSIIRGSATRTWFGLPSPSFAAFSGRSACRRRPPCRSRMPVSTSSGAI